MPSNELNNCLPPIRLVMNSSRTERTALGKQILLVEDHPDSAEAIRLILETEGYQVRWAKTAKDALQALSGSVSLDSPASPDLILLDLMLPDMDGVQMIQQLITAGRDLPPIIIASAKPSQAVASAARAIGAAGVVRKPFSLDELLGCVAAALSGKAVRKRESGK